MFHRGNKKTQPMLLGAPSPSLARMNKMNMAELTQRIERLVTEAQRVQAKIARLQTLRPAAPPERLASLTAQLDRLAALEKLARDKLAGKNERKQQYDREYNR